MSGMLSLRNKKPPADMPNINSGKPWSGLDLDDLEWGIEHGQSADRIADFLCRDVEEVEAKIAEMVRPKSSPR
jgi:hypothetical protein